MIELKTDPWLEKLPDRWQSRRLKHVASCNDEVLGEDTPKSLEIEYVDIGSVSGNGLVNDTERLEFASAPSRARRVVRDGDIIVSTVRTYLKAIAPIVDPPDNLIASTGFAVIRCNVGVVPRFMAYCLRTEGFVGEVISRSVGISYPAINATDLINIEVPVPSADEQKQIASFLDYETAKIDALIEKQQQLIALLGEKRQAVISHAVTKGLNPDAPMRDSGVEWLGEVPSHWQAQRLKYVVSCNDETLGDNTSPSYEIEYADISSVSGTGLIEKTERIEFTNAPSRARRVVRDGDVLVSTVRTYLKAIAPVVAPPGNLIASTGFAVIRCGPSVRPAFMAFCLRTEGFIGEVIARSVGISYPAINATDLVNIKIPIPDVGEQERIAKFLTAETTKIDATIRKSIAQVELLQERRTALISAAVTGKIDVRGWKRPSAAPKKETEMEVA